MGKNYKADLHSINTFVFDYDGVLTDGKVLLTSDGDGWRMANVKDGYAMQLAVKKGYYMFVISGGYSKSTQLRLENLGLKEIHLGVKHKIDCYHELMKKYDLKPENMIYMGDDIPDMKPMKEAGIACCPADAVTEIKEICDYISDRKGGEGCARDIIEQVLKVHNDWMDNDAHHW